METAKTIVIVIFFIVLLGIVVEAGSAALAGILRVIFNNWYWLVGAGLLYLLLNRKK